MMTLRGEMIMDPDEILEQLRGWCVETLRTGDPESMEYDAAQYFEALDGWLTRGGAWPRSWEFEARDKIRQGRS